MKIDRASAPVANISSREKLARLRHFGVSVRDVADQRAKELVSSRSGNVTLKIGEPHSNSPENALMASATSWTVSGGAAFWRSPRRHMACLHIFGRHLRP